MSTPIRVQISPLTRTIYAGRINSAGDAWRGEKHDVTSDVVGAIIEKVGSGHVLRVTRNDGKAFDIEVREVAAPAAPIEREGE